MGVSEEEQKVITICDIEALSEKLEPLCLKSTISNNI